MGLAATHLQVSVEPSLFQEVSPLSQIPSRRHGSASGSQSPQGYPLASTVRISSTALRRCLVSSLPGTAPQMQPALNKYLIIVCIMFTILQETVVRFRSCMPEELLVPSLRLEERRHTSHFVPGVPSSPCPVDKGVS